ncbi:MAG: lecithin retinol acyltransferase family protein [Treponema sp.]|nr:lecithin retinol acyltransferase family protein [Treponema sp.]
METKITNKPIPGDVLSVNRGLYRHYGVYVGNNIVVHFAGDKDFEISPKHAFIQKTSLEDFSKGNEVQTETRCGESFSRKETVMRALNAVGSEKGKYALAWNNCEHFATWCRYGKKRSAQVEHVLGGVATVAAIAIGAVVVNQIKNDWESA